jgi:hypothetical protein
VNKTNEGYCACWCGFQKEMTVTNVKRREGNHDNLLYTAVGLWIANLSGFCVYLLNDLTLRLKPLIFSAIQGSV